MRLSVLSLAALLAAALAPGQAPAGAKEYPPLPQGVSSLGAAVADGKLYVYGGHCGKTHQYSTEAVVGTFRRLDLSGGTKWEELPGGPHCQGLALVAHGGKLYRIGGMQPRNAPGKPSDNHSLASVARFDPATTKWEALPDLPEGRSSHDAVVLGDTIYVVGGWKMAGKGGESRWHTTALALDLTKKPLKWESFPQPFKRRALTASVHGGKIYVFGGLADGAKLGPRVDVYDPATRTWSKGPDLPGGPRNGFTPASCSTGGRLYLSPADGTLYRLDARGTAWEKAGRLEQPRVVHRLVAVANDRLLAVGGASKGGNIARTETLRPTPAATVGGTR